MPVPTPQVPLAVPAGTGREQRQWGQPGHRYEDAQRWGGGGGTGTVPPPTHGGTGTPLLCCSASSRKPKAPPRGRGCGTGEPPGVQSGGPCGHQVSGGGDVPPAPRSWGARAMYGGPCRLCCPGRASSQGRGASTGDTRVAPGPAPGQRRCWLRLPSQQLRRGAGGGLCRGAQGGGAAPPRPSGASPKRLG